MPEKYAESLQKALKSLQIADHMAYVTYPVIKDKRLLLKILEQMYETILNTINALLQYDYLWKRIQLYNDPKANFQTFREKCAPRYGITREQIQEIITLFAIIESHKKSPLEFARRDKVVIMTESFRTNIVDIEKIKKYLILAKKLLERAISGIAHRG